MPTERRRRPPGDDGDVEGLSNDQYGIVTAVPAEASPCHGEGEEVAEGQKAPMPNLARAIEQDAEGDTKARRIRPTAATCSARAFAKASDFSDRCGRGSRRQSLCAGPGHRPVGQVPTSRGCPRSPTSGRQIEPMRSGYGPDRPTMKASVSGLGYPTALQQQVDSDARRQRVRLQSSAYTLLPLPTSGGRG